MIKSSHTSELDAYLRECVDTISGIDIVKVEEVGCALWDARERGGTVFVIGNGGSASTASHMAADVMLTSGLKELGLRIVALSENSAVVTATGHDLAFRSVFARQLQLMASENDVLIAISASGTSQNVLEGVALAKEMGIETIGLTGFDGGEFRHLVSLSIHVESEIGAYGPVEDAHLVVNHMLTRYLQRRAARNE